MTLVVCGDTYGDNYAIMEEFALYKKSVLFYCFPFLGTDLSFTFTFQRQNSSIYAISLLEKRAL